MVVTTKAAAAAMATNGGVECGRGGRPLRSDPRPTLDGDAKQRGKVGEVEGRSSDVTAAAVRRRRRRNRVGIGGKSRAISGVATAGQWSGVVEAARRRHSRAGWRRPAAVRRRWRRQNPKGGGGGETRDGFGEEDGVYKVMAKL